MNYSLQTNYSNICRACLIENSNMKSVFSVEEILEQKILLCDMLMSCASILVMQGDGLPEYICINCFQQVNSAYLFRKLCERSDAALRECTTFSNLPEHQNDIFSISVDQNKFELDLNEKSLEKENYLKNDIEKQTCMLPTDGYLENSMDIDRNFSEIEETENEKTTLLSSKKSYPCKRCNIACLGLASFRTHMAEAHKEIFRCDQCGKEFNVKKLLARHIMSRHTNSTSSARQRNKTGIVKKRNLPRTCEICDKTFRFHSNLERHKLIHTGEKPYLCNVCGKGFAQMAYLKIHSFIHTGEKPYKCQMCDRSFAAPGTLMTHVRTHTGERPHICKICGKDFPQSGYLSAHIRTHTGEKPIECKVCNRRFNQSGRLIIHMRIHSGEKPYQCKECGRSFAVKGTLKKHMRTHTGERPYICKVCGQAFAQSGTLATHMKVHRPKMDSDNLLS